MRNEELYQKVTCELLQAMRGRRSRQAICRAMKCSDNLVSRWEMGNRTPTWSQFIHFATSCNVKLDKALNEGFGGDYKSIHSLPSQLIEEYGKQFMAERTELASARLQAIQSKPETAKLPEVLAIIDLGTTCFSTFIAALGPPNHSIPSLEKRVKAAQARKDLYAAHPILLLIEMCLALPEYSKSPKHVSGFISKQLGISVAEEERYLKLLTKAGTVRFDGIRYTHELQDLQTSAPVWQEMQRAISFYLEQSEKRLESYTTHPKEEAFHYFVFTTRSKLVPEIQKTIQNFWRDLTTKLQADEIHKDEQDRISAVCIQFFNLNKTSSNR